MVNYVYPIWVDSPSIDPASLLWDLFDIISEFY